MRYLLLLLLFASCRKQSDNSIVEAPAEQEYPYDYVLSKVTWSGAATNGYTTEYSYNNDNLISEIKNVQWAAGWVGHPYDTSYATEAYFLEYTGRLATKVYLDEPQSSKYWLYEYNNQGKPLKGTYYETLYKQIGDSANNEFEIIPDYPTGFQTYVYDERGNLVQKEDSADGKVNFRTTYEYNDSNNLERKTTFILWSQDQEKYMQEYQDYDNNVSLYKLIPGLPMPENFNINLGSVNSANNSRYELHYSSVKIDGQFQTASTLQNIFEYNEAALPAARKFPNESSVITYEY